MMLRHFFQKSINKTNVCVSAIYKIDNPTINGTFDERYDTISQIRNIKPEIIKVFHGTTLKSAKGIIENGFLTEYSKIAAYGKGTYCSQYASTAVGYCKDVRSHDKFSMIFLCRFIKGIFGNACGGIIDTTKYDYSGGVPNIYVTPYDDGIVPDYLLCYYSFAK